MHSRRRQTILPAELRVNNNRGSLTYRIVNNSRYWIVAFEVFTAGVMAKLIEAAVFSSRGSESAQFRALQIKPVRRARVRRTAHPSNRTQQVRVNPIILKQLVRNMEAQHFTKHDAATQRFRTHIHHLQ